MFETRRRQVVSMIGTIGLITAGVAEATTTRAKTVQEMTDGSGLVFAGTVMAVRYDVVDVPVTFYEVHIDEEYVGSVTSGTIEVLVMGGWSPDGKTFSYAPGAPSLAVDDRVIVFGTAVTDSGIALTSWSHGLVHHKTSGDGKDWATDAAGNPIVDWSCGGVPLVSRPLAEDIDGTGAADDRFLYSEDPVGDAAEWSSVRAGIESCVAQRAPHAATDHIAGASEASR